MKKLILALFFVLASTAMTWAANARSLVITFADGTQQMFSLSDLPDISMADDKMTITAGSTTAQYDLYTVKTFTFSSTATGINAVTKDEPSVEGDALIVPSKNAEVKVYALDGTEVRASVSRTDESTVVDLSSLPSGKIYIIRAAGKSVKIIR